MASIPSSLAHRTSHEHRTEADITPALHGRTDGAMVIAIAAGLMMIGLVMTASAAVSLADAGNGQAIWAQPTIRQAIFVGGGLLVMIVTAAVPYQIWRWRPNRFVLWQPALWLFMLALVLLALVFVPGIGVEKNGARRWIQLGPASLGLGFQPSELAKASLVILLAAWYASRPAGPPLAKSLWRGVLPSCVIIGLAVGAVGVEDFGTAALLAAIGGLLFFAAGARIGDLLMLSVPGSLALWHLVASEPYRLARLTNFTRIWDDPYGAGYHQVQSLCTIASGGWLGRGLGQGIQKYGYLPESRTDSVFAVVCEELGMPGACLVIAMFLALLWMGWRVAHRAPDAFGRHLAIGFTLLLVFQATMNIAVVTVSVPTKGIALPFVSAGGSGILFLSAMVGMLANVARQRAR